MNRQSVKSDRLQKWIQNINQCALKKKKSSLLKLDFMADTNKVLAKCVGEHTNIFKVLECFQVFLFVCLLIPFPFFWILLFFPCLFVFKRKKKKGSYNGHYFRVV